MEPEAVADRFRATAARVVMPVKAELEAQVAMGPPVPTVKMPRALPPSLSMAKMAVLAAMARTVALAVLVE